MVLNRTYDRLSVFSSRVDRLDYLKLPDEIPFDETFGLLRELNQKLYTSRAWRDVRDYVIYRDGGQDLGLPGYEIEGRILVHHMNPLTPDDLSRLSGIVFDPLYLITVSHQTHQYIHYGIAPRPTVIGRRPGDTTLWSRT